MNRFFLFGLMFLLTAWTPVMAQITVSESVLTDRIGTEVESTVYTADDPSAVADLVQLEGPDQVWDFTGLTFSDTLTTVQEFMTFPASVPGASSEYFSDATYVAALSNFDDGELIDTAGVWTFQQLDDDGQLFNLGLVLTYDVDEDGEADTLISRFEPPSLELVFPVTYESTWTDSSTLITSFEIPGFPPQDIASGTNIDTTVVDGWGTLITPDGSFPALRLNQMSTTITESPVPGEPVTVFTSTELTFLTASGPAASISLDEDGNPTDATYSTIGDSGPIPVEQDAVPDAFVLDQNYPNPFNPATLISYTLNEPGHVRLTVFDVQGRPVSTLVDGTQPVGRHGAVFDARTLPSGSYVYRLETPAGVQSRTMTLVR